MSPNTPTIFQLPSKPDLVMTVAWSISTLNTTPLPGIGHACGHNLIATASLAAFLALQSTLTKFGVEGRVQLLGTPAEELGGGKIALIEAGAYKNADVSLMGYVQLIDILLSKRLQ